MERGIAGRLVDVLGVDDHHADAGQVAQAHAFQQRLAGGVLGAVHDHEVGGAARFYETAVERTHARRVAGGETERGLGGCVAEAGKHGDHAQDAQRLHAGAGRRVGAEDHALALPEFTGRAQRQQRGLLGSDDALGFDFLRRRVADEEAQDGNEDQQELRHVDSGAGGTEDPPG